MALIKSHSNYVIRKRHQYTTDGTIFERDITTIGGLDQFAPGQVPVYRHGNFIITVNNEDNSSRHVMPVKWEENEDGNVWDVDALEKQKSDPSSVEDSIVIKKDYYNLMDFAYYGSCAELIRGSVTDIIRRFPGELYAPYVETNNGKVGVIEYYRDPDAKIPVPNPDGDRAQWKRLGEDKDLYLLSNPYAIDIHTQHIAETEVDDLLKYFANDGYKNYTLVEEGEVYAINGYSPIRSAISYITYSTTDTETIVTNTSSLIIRLTYTIFGKTKTVKLNPGESLTEQGNASEFGYEFGFGNVKATKNAKNTEVEYVYGGDYAFASADGNETALQVPVISYKQEIRHFEVVSAEYILCEGDELGHVTLSFQDHDDIIVYVYVGQEKKIKYMVEPGLLGIHIRPKREFLDNFMKSLSVFQSVLVTDKTDPKNKATFEIWEETDTGYNRYLRDFVFPLGEGGYNLGTDENSYQNYISSLLKSAVMYDENFCDNLYRSMTHESIKNLDWTYAKDERGENAEAEARITKVIRLYGREFDEIKAYIDNIGNVNTITYNDDNNLPDYFLTDSLELDGWDTRLVYPFSLSEYVESGTERTYVYDADELQEKSNTYGELPLHRLFSRDTQTVVRPYAYAGQNIIPCYPYGYYYICDDCGNSMSYKKMPAEKDKRYYSDPCAKNMLRRRISVYGSEREYTVAEANNAFEKRLRLNSRQILKHKGTVEGIEMMLAMFGMKSKRWYESLPNYKKRHFGVDGSRSLSFGCDSNGAIVTNNADEEVAFTYTLNGNTETVNIAPGSSIRIGEGCSEEYVFKINGIVVKSGDMTVSPGETSATISAGAGESSADVSIESYKRTEYVIDVDGAIFSGCVEVDEPEIPYDYDITEYTSFSKRISDPWKKELNNYIIDWFNSTKLITYSAATASNGFYEKYQGLPVFYRDTDKLYTETDADGNIVRYRYLYPYFDKTKELDGDPYFQMNGGWLREKPYKFDPEGNIMVEGGLDNFTETARNVRSVRTLDDLLAVPGQNLENGDVYYVTNLNGTKGIVDGIVYDLRADENGNRYFTVEVEGGAVKIGQTVFTYDVYVSVPDNGINSGVTRYSITDKEDGYRIDVYLNEDNEIRAYTAGKTVGSFTLFADGHYGSGDGSEYSHYFRINNVNYKRDLSEYGWEQLRVNDKDYRKLNAIRDYFKGNNPHSGKLRYDNGHEYFTYFQKLFRYPLENDLFDERCFRNDLVPTDASQFGFSGLIRKDPCDKEYDELMLKDTKLHFFGNYYENGELYKYVIDRPEATTLEDGSNWYSLAEVEPYGEREPNDGVTHQVVNNKRLKVTFFIKSGDLYSQEGLKEVKYLEDVVIPYMTQMVPSTAIINIEYTTSKGGDAMEYLVFNCENGVGKVSNTSNYQIRIIYSEGEGQTKSVVVEPGATVDISTCASEFVFELTDLSVNSGNATATANTQNGNVSVDDGGAQVDASIKSERKDTYAVNIISASFARP